MFAVAIVREVQYAVGAMGLTPDRLCPSEVFFGTTLNFFHIFQMVFAKKIVEEKPRCVCEGEGGVSWRVTTVITATIFPTETKLSDSSNSSCVWEINLLWSREEGESMEQVSFETCF